MIDLGKVKEYDQVFKIFGEEKTETLGV